MQEAVHQGRVFDLSREAELGLIVAHFAPAVALPIGVLPLPVTSVVLGLHLSLAVTSGGRHRPLDHRLVDHRNGDREICVLVVLVRDVAATVLLHHFDVARNADEAGPCGRISRAERTCGLGGVLVEPSGVDVIPEGVVTDDAVDTQLEAGEAGVEVGVGIPVAIVALRLEVERTTNTGIGNDDVKKLHASRFCDVEAEGIVFVLKVDERIVKEIEREVSDLVQVCGGEFDAHFAEVVTSIGVKLVVEIRDIPRLVIDQTAVGAVFGGNTEPFVTSATDVVRTEELFVDILGDAGVGLFELKDFFSGEEAIQKRLDANPVGVHLFTEQLESVALRAGALHNFAQGRAGVGAAVVIDNLAERGAGIVETTPEAERFLFGGVIEGPRLLLETGEVCGVGDELLHIEVVEILTALAEKGVQLFTAIELNEF